MSKLVVRVVFSLTFVALFAWFFLVHALSNWDATFHRYQVPSAGFPGWDSRNIQMAAYCLKTGRHPFKDSACVESGHLLKIEYPQGTVPVYNYPIWWAKAYAWFENDSEYFFLNFWRLNALALIFSIYWLSWRYCLWLLPVLLLNPVTLLTIERGNIDAIAFAMVLGVLSIRTTVATQILGLMAAAALKIYPLVGILVLIPRRFPFRSAVSFIFFLALLPILSVTLWDLPQYVNGTSRGYPFSYGLLAVRYAPDLSDVGLMRILMGGVVSIVTIAVGSMAIISWRQGIQSGIESLSYQEKVIFLVFLLIFLATFLVFTNWAYRMVFLYPVLALAVTRRGWPLKVFGSLMVLMLWMPWFAQGWEWQTWFAYIVAGLGFGVLGLGYKELGWRQR